MPKLFSNHIRGVLKVFIRDPKTRKLEEIGRLATTGVTAETIESWFDAITKPYKTAA